MRFITADPVGYRIIVCSEKRKNLINKSKVPALQNPQTFLGIFVKQADAEERLLFPNYL